MHLALRGIRPVGAFQHQLASHILLGSTTLRDGASFLLLSRYDLVGTRYSLVCCYHILSPLANIRRHCVKYVVDIVAT